MFYQTMYILIVLILLSLLVIEINSQGTFVHSDLGGHIVTNQIKYPNVNWQYAEPTDTLIKTEETGLQQEAKVDTEFLNLRQQLEIVRSSASIDLAQSAYIEILRQLQSKTEKAGLDELLQLHPDVLAVRIDNYPFFRGVSSFTSSSFVPGLLRRCGGIYFFVFDMFVLYIWTINRICKN